MSIGEFTKYDSRTFYLIRNIYLKIKFKLVIIEIDNSD